MQIGVYVRIALGALSLLVIQVSGAQTAPDAKTLRGGLSFAAMYEAARPSNIAGDGFWMNGGSVEAHIQFPGGLGLDLDGTALHTPQMIDRGPGLRLGTMTTGPRYTWASQTNRVSIFAHGMTGLAVGFNKEALKAPVGYGAATIIGGGVNVSVSRHLSIRVLDANWLRTQVPNATTDVQNGLRLGTGLVYSSR